MADRVVRTPAELMDGASDVAHEWRTVADIASRLTGVTGARSPRDSTDLDSGMIRYRCIVNFLCGNYTGTWGAEDLKPSDFLGREWLLPDEEYDRHLRGRLQAVNKGLLHLSWRRPDLRTIWPFGLLAHEADYALRLFLKDVPEDAPWAAPLREAALYASETLPPREQWRATAVDLAPARR